jgi:hypothetical protein
MKTTTQDWSVGATLSNGYVIVAHHISIGDSQNVHVVMAYGEGNVQPYVTWLAGDDGYCFFGHYFGNILDAAKDYTKRTLEHSN